jgi:hypothetical protein
MTPSLPASHRPWLAGFGHRRRGALIEHMFEVIPGYTRRVKTAISMPDETFALVEAHAAALGVSRSEFFATAARRYVEHLEATSLTARINLALDVVHPHGITVDMQAHRAAARVVPW